MKIPDKLKPDAITDAIFELRFETDLAEEVIVGRLLDRTPWANFRQQRLALADVPGPVRRAQESMRFQPVFEARQEHRVVKIGANSISFHALDRYPGWGILEQQLHEAIDEVFSALQSITIDRIGLRYVNAMNQADHFVAGFDDLTLAIQLRGTPLPGPKNLNFLSEDGPDMHGVTRIASRDFVTGRPPASLELLVDIDVFTPGGHEIDSSSDVKAWLSRAHDFEKKCFFALLRDETIDKLAQEEG